MGLKSILVCFQITYRLFHRRRKKILSSKRRSILEVWYNVSYSFIHVLVFVLLFCLVAYLLWMYMLRLFGVDWVMLGSVVDLFFCWYHWLGKHSSDIWNLVLGCLTWTIWTKWNRHSFEDNEKTVVQLVDLCQRTLFDWSRCWGLSNCSTLMDFLLFIRIA